MRRLFGSHILRLAVRSAGSVLLLALLVAGALVRSPVPFDGGLRAAHAQWWGDDRNPWGAGRPNRRPSYSAPQQRGGGGGGFFGIPFFGGWGNDRESPEDGRPRREPPARVDFSRAPPPKKLENPPAKSVLVLGDAMADWLGSGLEEAFAEENEYGVVRKAHANSGLVHNEPREYDWIQTARETLSGEKPDFIVVMLGLSDRRAFRERAPARTQPATIKGGQTNDPPSVTEPERHGITSYEFRSDKWSELYAKRVDEMIAVLKSKRVPVLWVGLPPVRGPKARGDVAFLNDIYKAEAEKNGIVYVDVWDGFVDDAGEFSYHGPDVLGQPRRLRSGDGVYFTKAGARKLAHYVDREMRRLLNRETTPVALPIPSDAVQPATLSVLPSGPAPRPVAGPVIPLTGGRPETEALLGGRGDAPTLDPTAVKVLVNGEAPAPATGRADNFAWPRAQTQSENDTLAPPVAAPARAARPAAAAPIRSGHQRAASAAATPPAKHVRPTTLRRAGRQAESAPAGAR
jgi:hypothetical protein